MGDKFKLVLKIEERFNAGNAQRKVFGKIKGRPNKNIEVIHHSGVKGMKWGVRNGPPYPIKNKGKVAKAQSTLKNADGKDIIMYMFSIFPIWMVFWLPVIMITNLFYLSSGTIIIISVNSTIFSLNLSNAIWFPS